MRLVEVFEDGERLEERRPAFIEHERRHHALRIDGEVTLFLLLALKKIDRDLLGVDTLEGHRDAHAVGRKRAPETVELHGITGRSRKESPRWSVVGPPKIAAGRSRGSSWRKGPQPRSSF